MSIKDEAEIIMEKAAKAADELYIIRDTYFPLNPNDKIITLHSQSDLALKLLDSIPPGQFLHVFSFLFLIFLLYSITIRLILW